MEEEIYNTVIQNWYKIKLEKMEQTIVKIKAEMLTIKKNNWQDKIQIYNSLIYGCTFFSTTIL